MKEILEKFKAQRLLRFFSNLEKKAIQLADEKFVYLMIAVYFIIFSYITILKHIVFQSTAGDLGLFDQSLWTTLNSNKFLWNTVGPWNNPPNFGSIFNSKFQPILLLILPIYAIHQVPETLLVLQSFFLALGALPLYWITRDVFQSKAVGVGFAASYLMYPALHGINWFDFHTEALIPAFLLFAFYFFKERRWVLYYTFVFLTLMCTEEVALIIVSFGLFEILFSKNGVPRGIVNLKAWVRDRTVTHSILTVIIGVLWLVSAFNIISYLNPGKAYPHLHLYKNFGKDLPSALLGIIKNPGYALSVILTPSEPKFLYLSALFLPLCLLPFLDPMLLTAIPMFIVYLLADRFAYWSIYFHNTSLIIPSLFVSAIYGAKRLVGIQEDTRRKRILGVLTIIMAGSLLTCIFLSPVKNLPILKMTPHIEVLKNIVDLVPPDASILTQNDIFPHLSHRTNIYVQYYSILEPEYILVDTTSKWYCASPAEGREGEGWITLNNILSNETVIKGYQVLSCMDGVVLFRRGGNFSLIHPLETTHGLSAKFYNNMDLSGEPVFQTILLTMENNWRRGSPIPTIVNDDRFSIELEGYLKITKSGEYTFRLKTDDGSRLFINDQILIDSWGPKICDNSFSINLGDGFHRIRIEYMESGGSASFYLGWIKPITGDSSMEPISAEYLYNTPENDGG